MKAIIAALWLLGSPPVEPADPPADEAPAVEPTEPAELTEDEAAPAESEPAPEPEAQPEPQTDVVALESPREPVAVGAPTESIEPPPPPAPSQPKRPDWRRWGSPLLSTFIPGTGQLANRGLAPRQVIKGVALLYGTVLSVAGAAVLYTSTNDGYRSLGREYARLVGYGVLSTAAPMLWIYAIADAWRIANHQTIESHAEHRVRVTVARSMSVGFRADPDRPGFYDDWSASLIGQPIPRLGVGVSDLGLKFGRDSLHVFQFGLRLGYRVVERRLVWLELAVGTQMQVASSTRAQPLDRSQARPGRELRFGATPYAQLDLRLFVLDRLSLDLTPRLSVPVTTRYYAAGSLPRFAPMLELGAGASIYF